MVKNIVTISTEEDKYWLIGDSKIPLLKDLMDELGMRVIRNENS